MICPRCGHDHDGKWPKHGLCVLCGEDMSDMVNEANREWDEDNRRRDKNTGGGGNA